MMLTRRTVVPLLLTAPSLAHAQNPPAPPSASGRTPLLIPGKQSLYQRVIVRPGATMTPQAGGTGGQPVPGFSVFYVYARQGGDTGSIEVGRTAEGRTEGWIPAAKAIDWMHTMVAAFTNPAGRQRVLFLNSEREERLLMLNREAASMSAAMRQAALAGNPGPVVALEPEAFVDITRHFYLLPILHADQVEREVGPPMRVLEIISAPAEQQPSQPRTDPNALRNFKAGAVFVIDTTQSMQPYIERTREAIRSIVTRIGTTPVKDNFRFGLVAYRDSLDDNPGLEYAAKVYARPDFTRPADAILPAIASVRDSPVSSTGFDEDPIGGLKAAIDDVDWEGLAGRYIILITDAGARPSTHRFSVTHMNIHEIRELAKAKGIAIFAIHLLTPEGRARHDHEPARAQYEELTRFGAGGPLYFPVPNGSPESFAQTVQALSLALLQQVSDATGQPIEGLVPTGSARPQAQDQHLQDSMRVVAEAMRLAYLGRVENTQAPDVVRSWTTDRDLGDSSIAALDVRVLLTRNQLSDLAHALQNILQAGLAGRTEPRTFFTQLRAAFAAAARDPQRIARADRIGGLLGEYLDDLPYTSEIMDITEPDWLAMGAIAQRTVLNNVEARLRLYQEFQSHPDLWVDLSGTRSAGEAMYPVPIEALP